MKLSLKLHRTFLCVAIAATLVCFAPHGFAMPAKPSLEVATEQALAISDWEAYDECAGPEGSSISGQSSIFDLISAVARVKAPAAMMAVGTGISGNCCICVNRSTRGCEERCQAFFESDKCQNTIWVAWDSIPIGENWDASRPLPAPPAGVRCETTYFEAHGHMDDTMAVFCAKTAYQLCINGGGSVCANFVGCRPLANYNSTAEALENALRDNPFVLPPGATISITGAQSTVVQDDNDAVLCTETNVTVYGRCDDQSVSTTLPACSSLKECWQNNETIDCTGTGGSTEKRICCGAKERWGNPSKPGSWQVPGPDGKCPSAGSSTLKAQSLNQNWINFESEFLALE